MRIVRTDRQDLRRERRRGSQSSARLHVIREKQACSPRAAVAFSALSAVTWLREKGRDVVGWIRGKWNLRVHQKVGSETRKNSSLNIQGN
jgi:hypothetical protein